MQTVTSPALEGPNERERKTLALLGTGSLFVPARGVLKLPKGTKRKEPGWAVTDKLTTSQSGERRAEGHRMGSGWPFDKVHLCPRGGSSNEQKAGASRAGPRPFGPSIGDLS